MINNATSLDDKLLISFIRNNYEKIIKKNFSIPSLFFSWFYTLYRKVYILSIIGMIIILILGFLPSMIAFIIALSFSIVLGLNFNKWYIIYSRKQINKIKTNNHNISENELINICKKKGGTNIWLAIIIYVIFFIISNLLT